MVLSRSIHYFLVVLLCCYYFFYISSTSAAQYDSESNPSAVLLLVGTLHCDDCYKELSKEIISVEIECLDASSTPILRKAAMTNEKGVFKLRLRRDRTKLIKSCSVKLANTNEPFCMVPSGSSPGTSNMLQLMTRKNGVKILSFGLLSFKPLKLCDHHLQPFLLPTPIPIPTPTPIPFLPSPPVLPPVLPPLQPPPSILPPVLPVPPTPPHLPLPPLPPLPIPLPSPPSPPLPPPGFHLPPLPIPPVVPGVPPASP